MKKYVFLLLSFMLASSSFFGQETSEEIAEQAMQIYESHKDSDVFTCMVALEYAIASYLTYDAEKAREALQYASTIADTSQINILSAMTLYLAGMVESSTGNLDRAIKLFSEAEVIFKKDDIYTGDKNFTLSDVEVYKADIKRGIGDSYRKKGEIVTAKEFFQEYLDYALKNEHDSSIGAAYGYLGICSDLEGDYHAAIEFYNQAIAFGKLKQLPDIYVTYGNLGFSYYALGERRKSLEYFLINADGAEDAGNLVNLANAYTNIRDVLIDLEDYEGFFDYGKKAETIFKENESNWFLARLYNENAETYIELDSLELAIDMVDKSIAISQENNFSDAECVSLRLTGEILQSKKNYTGAEEWLAKAVEYGKSNGLQECEYTSLLSLGSNYVLQRKDREAIEILKLTINKYSEDQNNMALMPAKKNISKAYASIGNYNKAYQSLTDYIILNDSLNDLSSVSKLARTKSDYQYEKEKEINDLENQKQQEILVAQANTNKAIAFGIGAIGLLGFWFFYHARRKNNTIALKNQQLESLNHTKDQIFSIIGHDLKKPALAFRGITNKLNYLIEGDDKKRLLKFGASIETDAIELNKLTDNLLNWALLQKDLVSANSEQLSLKDLVAENISLFKRIADEKNITFNSELGINSVKSDKHILSTVIRNLLDNAIKYTEEGGTVSIMAKEISNKISLSVEDSGVGMSTTQVNNLFILDKGKSTKGTEGEGGTGLGMHLVQQLVAKIEGTIEVASELGKGSAFTVTIPAVA